MKKTAYIFTILKPFLEIIIVMGAFLSAYFLRSITDGIPFIQLRIPFISFEQFLPYIAAGVIIWIIVFGQRGLYGDLDEIPFVEEIRQVFIAGFIWLIGFVGIIYFGTGPIFSKEIPRLIVLYTFVFSIPLTLIFRASLRFIYTKLKHNNFLSSQKLLIIYTGKSEEIEHIIDLEKHHCQYMHISDTKEIGAILQKRQVDAIVLVLENPHMQGKEIFEQARIYGIPCLYPQILPHMTHFSRRERFIGNTPMLELSAISIGFWQSVLKRIFDIFVSSIGLVILLPVFFLIYCGIKIEDASGPAIYKNRRIGRNGKPFTLYKFRYMYWKDSIKEAYGKNTKNDDALQYEESLKKQNNTRTGPLYKIQNDPRKMKFGSFIERLSLDELPQLFNVLIGDMSLIGPRPHQPREVELYSESDKQVLTVHPGITGMAQVYGRDKNSFDEEIGYDTYYIENYSFFLDLAIFVRTIFVVLNRPFKR